MGFSFRSDIRRINRSLDEGLFTEACREIRRSRIRESAAGERLADQVVTQLIGRANRRWIAGDLAQAWQDLSDAASISSGRQFDQIAAEKNQLVEKTIDLAAQQLNAGKAADAERTLELLRSRRILDRRADQIRAVAQLITAAETLAARGQFHSAVDKLRTAAELRPDLDFISTRISGYQAQDQQLDGLTRQLRRAITESAWSGARDVTRQMLQIAPEHQVALDALARCDDKEVEARDRRGIRDTRQNADQNTAYGSDSVPMFIGGDELGAEIKSEPIPRIAVSGKSQHGDSPGNSVVQVSMPDDRVRRSFMLWIDGVGGYLVCTSKQVIVGQAIPRAGVDIPLQADVRRHHLKINRLDDAFVVDPIGHLEIDGKTVETVAVIRDGDVMNLGNGVRLQFRQTGALGRSAKIEFTSRHRTEPWSDAVFLMGDALVLGNGPDCHIVCPEWDEKMVLFWDQDHLVFRGPDAMEINGKNHAGDAILQPDMRIAGENFAITVETVS